ncbi:MAG TPA: cytochrome P450 [Streptosporangiaceae bacterium]|jgi:cholest-4-en-3-one 26-monooxygenase|nr:cytochrome P450 [Streptosporangiaceae bacterium]
MAGPQIPAGFDFTDPDLYAHRVPNEEFAELRRAAPIWWNEQPDSGFDDGGFWVVSKHADVMEISRNSDLFSSWENTAIIRHGGDIRDSIDVQRLILLNLDPPQHTKLRQIVSRGFTPRAINNLRDRLAERAENIVRTAIEKGTGDFVADVACELPLQAIADLIGVPQEDRKKIFEWSNVMVGYDDPEFGDAGMIAAAELVGYSMAMAEDRKQSPRDDIVTRLVNAEVDGDRLSSDEFGYFVILMSVAGNETTRNAISHGMVAFFDHPEQWELYREQRPATAADEIVRWATPVTVFQRTAKADTVIGGQEVKKGQRLGLFYRSANFDEDVFSEPAKFDVLRDPNPHLGFGGTGAHYCIGVNLARMEIDLIFNAIADAMPNIALAGEAERLRSGWLNGIKRLPVAYS